MADNLFTRFRKALFDGFAITPGQSPIVQQGLPSGEGFVQGTDVANPSQEVATREGFAPVTNPQSIPSVSTADWFGPLEPLRSSAPKGTEPRKFEYIMGQNLQFTPRANERVQFQTLRDMAENLDILRIVIETAKNNIRRLDYDIHKEWDSTVKQKDRKLAEAKDPIIAEIKALLKRPDGLHSWGQFVNEVLEDKFVVDAPCVWVQRSAIANGKNKLGKVERLIPIDGTRITRYLNTSGLTPMPNPSCNQPGHTFLNQKQDETPEGKTPSHICDCAAYTQYLYGSNAVNLTVNDIVYFPYNTRSFKLYGYSEVEQIIIMFNLALNREISLVEYFTSGNMPDMLAFLPNSMSVDQVKEFESWFNSVQDGRAFKRRVRFVPSPAADGKPQLVETKSQLFDGTIDEWISRVIAYAFNLPPTALVKMMNRATSQQSSQDSEESGFEPYKLWFEDLMNYIIQVEMGYEDYYFTWQTDKETDLLKQRQADEIKVQNGGMTLNEWRENEGQDPYDVSLYPDADKPLLITKQGYVIVGDQANQAPQDGVQNIQSPDDDEDDDETPPPKGGKPKPKNPKGGSSVKKSVTRQPKVMPSVHPGKFNPDTHHATTKLEAVVHSYLQKQAEGVANILSRVAKADDPEQDALFAEIENQLHAEDMTLPVQVKLALEEAVLSGVTQGLIETGKVALFPELNATARDFAQNRAAELVGLKYVDGALVDNPDAKFAISDTTRDDIRSIITKGFEQNTPKADIAANIVNASTFSQSRAKMIARTEVSNAQVKGNFDAWVKSGVVNKVKWLVGDPCDVCAMNADVVRPIGEPFPSGHIAPTVHPNCACGLVAVVDLTPAKN